VRGERGSSSAAPHSSAPASMIATSVQVVRSSWEPPREAKAVATTAITIAIVSGCPESGGSGRFRLCSRCRSGSRRPPT
jgi:hypothetical protein